MGSDAASLLKVLMSRTLLSANIRYRRSISATAELSAPAAFLGSVITGISRWGMPLYSASSTTLGSIRISLTSSGPERNTRLMMMLLTHTDLPLPVLPAMSRWGILHRSATWATPAMSLPRAMVRGLVMWRKLWLSKMLRMLTDDRLRLGTSMPTAGLPGMGASMRMSATARFRARSSAREVMRLILTPAMGCTSYRVTAGPREISSTRVLTPKLSSVSTSFWALA